MIVNQLSVHDLEERFASLTREWSANRSAAWRIRRSDAWPARRGHSEARLEARHSATAAPPPRLVLATEDTCWIGSNCAEATKDAFVRARLRADPNARHRFMHSQMIGTRAGMLELIQSGLASGETDDMKMMFDYIVVDASRVAFDDDETIFATFARGFVPGQSTSKLHTERNMMCWDGVCSVNRNGTRSVTCSTSRDGTSVALHDARTQRTVSPLMWHLNGPSIAFVSKHPTCATAIERARGGTRYTRQTPRPPMPSTSKPIKQPRTPTALEHLFDGLAKAGVG